MEISPGTRGRHRCQNPAEYEGTAMEITNRKHGDICIVRVDGRLDFATAREFEKFCFEWIDRGESKFIFDFERLEYVSSAGLRGIIAVEKKIKPAGGVMGFCSLTPNVAHVFSISNFKSLFTVSDSLEQALERM
ncbi:MAG: STAS domain-containing protein [Desulfobacteraceae bacterium]|nr:STAS domain-containing protein [Desulfobacteraceae bacterium]